MNGPEMVVLIVAITAIASIIRARMGIRRGKHGEEFVADIVNGGETKALRDEVKTLKERIIVLERIATDKGNLLEQEFERLRQEK